MHLADAAARATAALSGSRRSAAAPGDQAIAPLLHALSRSSAPDVAAAKPALTAALRLALLCGHEGTVRCAYLAVEAASHRGDAEGDAIVIDLLPLLLDQAASFSALAAGDLAHACALAALSLLPRAAAAAVALQNRRDGGSTSFSRSVTGRRWRAETMLTVLSRQPLGGAASADSRADAVIRKLAVSAAAELEVLLSDPDASCRHLARHAYLALVERCPRLISHRLAQLPHRLRLSLRHTAAARSHPLGPPLLPPPPLPPPTSQAIRIQAFARGRHARRRAARLTAWTRTLSVGARVRVMAGGSGVLAWSRVSAACEPLPCSVWSGGVGGAARQGANASGTTHPGRDSPTYSPAASRPSAALPSLPEIGATHQGTLLWRGTAPLGPGEWFGLALDAPAGRHDGALLGHRYFSCEAKCGLVVRASCLIPEGGWSKGVGVSMGAGVGDAAGAGATARATAAARAGAGAGPGAGVEAGAEVPWRAPIAGAAMGHEPSPAEPAHPRGRPETEDVTRPETENVTRPETKNVTRPKTEDVPPARPLTPAGASGLLKTDAPSPLHNHTAAHANPSPARSHHSTPANPSTPVPTATSAHPAIPAQPSPPHAPPYTLANHPSTPVPTATAAPPSTPAREADVASLIGSHRAALHTMRAIADGQHAIIRALEAETTQRGWTPLRSARAAKGSNTADPVLKYAEQMEALCAQSRLVASQLHDSMRELLEQRRDAI